jgi:hypothetical protein
MNAAVYSFCDLSGVMVEPWARAGFECWCFDIRQSIRKVRTERVGAGIIHFVWADVRTVKRPTRKANRRRVRFPAMHSRLSQRRTRFCDQGRPVPSRCAGDIRGLPPGPRMVRCAVLHREPGRHPFEHSAHRKAGSLFSSVGIRGLVRGRQLHQENLPVDRQRIRDAAAATGAASWRA